MTRVRFLLFAFCLLLLSGSSMVMAQSQPGLLRVASFQYPNQVAPSSTFSVGLDVEYAIHGPENATIKATILDGSSQLWQSDPVIVSGGGDRTWAINITAPSTDGVIHLAAYAFYLDNGEWKFYNDTLQGPGYASAEIKVSSTANLTIELGVPKLEIAIGNLTEETSQTGDVQVTLRVSATYAVTVPSTTQFDNSTRIVFNGWSDGTNQTKRTITLDGDMNLTGSYRTQYMLRVSSIVSEYSFTRWIDAGSNVTLQAQSSVPAEGLLGTLKLNHTFLGWSGDVRSSSPEISVLMNSPKTINVDYLTDYGPLVYPSILVLGIVGGIILALSRRRRLHAEPEEKESKATESTPSTDSLRCFSCGEAVEKEWTHCIRCGADLTGSRPVDQ